MPYNNTYVVGPFAQTRYVLLVSMLNALPEPLDSNVVHHPPRPTGIHRYEVELKAT